MQRNSPEVMISDLRRTFVGGGNMQKHRGFTLIELMIVVAIIGILAAVSIAAYGDYVAKAQASEALSLLTGKKTPLSEFYDDMGRWPAEITSIADEGISGKFVSSITITSGAGSSTPLELTATFKNNGVSDLLKGKTIILTSVKGTSWTCGSAVLAPRILPSACR